MPSSKTDERSDLTAVVAADTVLADEPAGPAVSTELLRTVFNHIPVMLVVADADGEVRLINHEVERVLGWSADEWCDPDHADRCHPEPDEAAAVRSARRAADGLWRDVRMTTRDSRVLHTSWAYVRLSDGSTVAIGQDVTPRRLLEEQLRQAGKLEALGLLAGGVAHDFNNLLAIIQGHIGLAQSVIRTDDPLGSRLDAARQATEQAAEMTRNLLAFAHRQPPKREVCRLSVLVDETVRLLRRTIDPRVTFTVVHGANGVVRADTCQLKQVLLNLCLNARDAMPDGGQLTLETVELNLPQPAPNSPPGRRAGAFTRLRVSDTGEGMTPEVLDRLFEAFFTTKPVGRGTGLGLSLVQSIVKQHEGWVEVQSEPGCGTRFDVYLPRGSGAATAVRPTVAPVRGTETVLIVDDERLVGDLSRSFLEANGYRVLLANDGAEAVGEFSRAAGGVDLVVLDLRLPKVAAAEVLRRLRSLDPKVRVLVTSGYALDRLDPAERAAVAGCITKPYRPQELARAVRVALDGKN